MPKTAHQSDRPAYQIKLRQLLEANSAAESLTQAFETTLREADEGDYERASSHASAVHSRSLEIFGDASPITFLFQFLLADLLAQSNKIDETIEQFTQLVNALTFSITSNMPEGNETAAELFDLAVETGLAGSTFRPVLTRFVKEERQLVVVSNLVSSLLNSHPRQACLLSKALFEARKQVLGEDHDDTLLAGHKLAMALTGLREYQAALPLALKILEIRQKRFGFAHVLTLRSAGLYATVLCGTGSWQEALVLQQKVYEASKALNGDGASQTQIALRNLMEMAKDAASRK